MALFDCHSKPRYLDAAVFLFVNMNTAIYINVMSQYEIILWMRISYRRITLMVKTIPSNLIARLSSELMRYESSKDPIAKIAATSIHVRDI